MGMSCGGFFLRSTTLRTNPHPDFPATNVHVCPILVQEVALYGVCVEVVGVARQGVSVDLGRGGERTLDGEDSKAGRGEHWSSHPAERTRLEDLRE